MLTLVVVLVVVAVAAAIAYLVNGRSPDAPSTPQFAAPQQLDRSDFERPETPWLLALFSSETCLSCHDARAVLSDVSFSSVVVQDLPVESHKAVHDRYGVDAVPIVTLADTEGVVRWSWLGAPPQEAVRDALVDAGIIAPDSGTAVDFP
ncbi:MAG: hypothetical protein AAF480_03150 [Actinomycetota bacterium]